MLPSELARYEEVVRLGQDWREPLSATIARAFADDPVWQWALDIDRTLTLDEGLLFARALVADTSPADEIHGFRHHDAVALWRAPAEQISDDATAWKEANAEPFWQAFAAQVGARRELLGELGAAMSAARPAEPHWYLSILGTAPERQGTGLGARVVAPMIERCDRLGMATYLESSNPRNHSFYARLGYQEQAEISAAGSPPVMGFLRPAR